MTALPASVYIAHTHREWYDHLSRKGRPGAGGARLDEVNFWSPRSRKPIKDFRLGEPLFFRLGAPTRRVAGHGFYAGFHLVDVHLAWEVFGEKNGAPTKAKLARVLGRTGPELSQPLACTILRDAVFWPERSWEPWGTERDYARTGVQQGRTDADRAHIERLMAIVGLDALAPPPDLLDDFTLVDTDQRRIESARQVQREGQGTFRLRLLDAYGRQCAVTREHTEPVLAAAHIQPYLGPASNHIRNGLLLTQEFHTLFDRGFATVETDGTRYRLRLSEQIHKRWQNGHRYYEHNHRELHVPDDPRLAPSPRALQWHRDHVFERV